MNGLHVGIISSVAVLIGVILEISANLIGNYIDKKNGRWHLFNTKSDQD